MSVLAFGAVSKVYLRGHREHVALRNVSLEIASGEVVCISGARHSGRTTLLRLAAGIERPDSGRVLIAGTDLATARSDLWRQIAFCNTRFLPGHGHDALAQVATPLFAVRVSKDEAGRRAHRALVRVGGDQLSFTRPDTWTPSEAMRVALARALVREPRLLLVDEPTSGVDLTERDELLALIRDVTRATGIATAVTAGETTSNVGSDRILMLSEGELLGRTSPRSNRPEQVADIVPLRRRASEPRGS